VGVVSCVSLRRGAAPVRNSVHVGASNAGIGPSMRVRRVWLIDATEFIRMHFPLDAVERLL
jgi:hypothetical protein